MVFVSREAAGVASRDDETDPILGNATPLRPGPRLACTLSAAAMSRTASLKRTTSETDISLTLSLDGSGRAEIATGIGFLDHMLTALARHALFDLAVKAKGDLHIDFHHTTEDVGIVLGQAFAKALGDKRGIRRFGHALVPMDETLAEAALDISGRPFLAWDVTFERPKIGEMDTELFEEFFRAFAMNALVTLHVTRRAGRNAHHVAEACFKATARALRMAAEPDPRVGDAIPSTKGAL
jgi:imidazoleglycerol-phosphate dehydratase